MLKEDLSSRQIETARQALETAIAGWNSAPARWRSPA